MNRRAVYSFVLSGLAMLCGTIVLLQGADATPLWVLASAGGGAGAMAATNGPSS